MRTIKVGVVGCGRNSDNHLRVYSKTKGVQLVAVCDRNLDKAKQKARKYGAERSFADYTSMLALDLDLVDIITPTPSHAHLAKLALQSGINVLVEKPMAVSSTECLEMINAARKSSRTLCVAHTKRFFDAVIQTKATIDRERLTATRMRVSQFLTNPYPDFRGKWILTEESGGVLWDGLVHQVYLVEDFLGKAESVYACGNRLNEPVDDSITFLLKANGKTGVCEFEWNAREPMTEFLVMTREGDRFDGNLDVDYVLRRSRTYRNRGVSALRLFSDDVSEPFTKWRALLGSVLHIRSYPGALPFEKCFFTLIRRLVSFLVGLSASPPVLAEEGLRTVRVLEAARQSIETGKAVRLE